MKFTRLLFSWIKKIYCHHDIGIKQMIKLEENIYHKMQWCFIVLFLVLFGYHTFRFLNYFNFFSIILFFNFFFKIYILFIYFL